MSSDPQSAPKATRSGDAREVRQRILQEVKAEGYTPVRPRQLAKAIAAAQGRPEEGIAGYDTFRGALKDLMDDGDVILGSDGSVLMPSSRVGDNELIGTYKANPKGFGFVIPQEQGSHEDLFIPPYKNEGAMSGDVVRAKIIPAGERDGKPRFEGKILEVIERQHTRFAGTMGKIEGTWFVFSDGKKGPEPIAVPDAGSKHVIPGQKVIVELTSFGDGGRPPQGVISEVLGDPGDKDVDLRSAIVQFGLPEEFPREVVEAAGKVTRAYDPEGERAKRVDLTNELICTIDPDTAKDYDDAISLSRTDDGLYKLGVHIADVSHFVKSGGVIDQEAYKRGNSTYFPGHVIPMLPEVLSNGVCSLVEGEPRLVKSCFIWIDPRDGRPVRTAFSNSVIHSSKRLTYVEAQDLIDGKEEIRRFDGNRKRSDYDDKLLKQLRDMDECAKILQKRRQRNGQITLNIPSVELELDEQGKVVGAGEEDDSFTHTLIEMFMVEANEAVARLFAGMGVPHIRRIHPGPDADGEERLKHYAMSAGHQIPELFDRHALQALLNSVKGHPDEFAVNMAVLRSISQATYSPKLVGHFALGSEHYSHFTSPIRRYADLMIHRLLDRYFEVMSADFPNEGPIQAPVPDEMVEVGKDMSDMPSADELEDIGSFISYTERRSEAAERELKAVKVLQLLADKHVGDTFKGVVTGITNFGLFIQIETYLAEGLVRYPDLLDDWWDVDAKAGVIRGQRDGQVIRIGDLTKVQIANVDVPRRELDLVVLEVLSRGTGGTGKIKAQERADAAKAKPTAKFGDVAGGLEPHQRQQRTGADKRAARSQSRDKRGKHRGKLDKKK